MKKEQKHLFVTETEGAKENFVYKVEPHELLTDVKVLLQEYYFAAFTEDGGALTMSFSNGQKFKLSLTEIK